MPRPKIEVYVDSKLQKWVWKKRAGLELIESINKKIAKIQALCQSYGFLQTADEIQELTKEMGQDIDRLFNYMMRPRRGEKCTLPKKTRRS